MIKSNTKHHIDKIIIKMTKLGVIADQKYTSCIHLRIYRHDLIIYIGKKNNVWE
jgi:hypothetical protein